MLKIGQIFEKDGIELCLLEIVELFDKKYVLFSAQLEKMEYYFYEVVFLEEGYKFIMVEDEEINNKLFNSIGGIISE